ncbi:hypothetical protein PT974_11186 [Cladobotryum mycophilum]|uniref:Uncharacterized protein n=1 Tax=Cladobotryum mycophilum TaxID=491253 RepID=A0ABR0S4H4_9HYPO
MSPTLNVLAPSYEPQTSDPSYTSNSSTGSPIPTPPETPSNTPASLELYEARFEAARGFDWEDDFEFAPELMTPFEKEAAAHIKHVALIQVPAVEKAIEDLKETEEQLDEMNLAYEAELEEAAAREAEIAQMAQEQAAAAAAAATTAQWVYNPHNYLYLPEAPAESAYEYPDFDADVPQDLAYSPAEAAELPKAKRFEDMTVQERAAQPLTEEYVRSVVECIKREFH